MSKPINIAFKTDAAIVQSARDVFKAHNYSLTGALRTFLTNVAITGEVDLPSPEELEKERLLRELQAEVKASLTEMAAGQYYTEEELRDYLDI